MATGKPKPTQRPEVLDLIGLWGEETDESLEEEEESLESREYENLASILPETQELILTPKQSTSTQDSTNDPMEGTSDTAAVDRPLRSAAERLYLIRKRKRKNRDDMFSELMRALISSETEKRMWRQSMSQAINSAIESHRQTQETVRSISAEVLKLLREQSDVFRHLVDLQERRQGPVLLQPLQNAPETSVMVPSTSPATTRSRAKLSRMQPLLSSTPASSHPTPGDSA